MSTAFQADAFQTDVLAFQIGTSPEAEVPPGATGSSDGYGYYQPKKKDIKRMLKAWGALEEFENYFPPAPKPEYVKLQRRGAPEPTYRIPAKTEPTFEWWDKNAKPEPPQWTAKRGSKFEWWKN
jgi:hypothetical protein